MKLSENIRYMANHLSEVDSDYLNDIAASFEAMETADDEGSCVMDDFATLRDQFAMAALQGMLAGGANIYDFFAVSHAYAFADAMLEERK